MCQTTRARMLLHLLGFLPGDEGRAVQAHLDACDSCRRAFAECDAQISALRAWPDRDPPPEALDALLAESRARAAAAGRPGEGDSLERELRDLENLAARMRTRGTRIIEPAPADVPAPVGPAPGRLTVDERERLIRELGLDGEPGASEAKAGPPAAPGLEDLAEAAERVARRKGRRSERIEVSGAAPDERGARGAGPEDADALLGTTILPASGGEVPSTRRLSSRLLALARSEDPARRERRRRARAARGRMLPAVVAAAVHALAAAALGWMVFETPVEREIRGVFEAPLREEILAKDREIPQEPGAEPSNPDPTTSPAPENPGPARDAEGAPAEGERGGGAPPDGIPKPDAPPEAGRKGVDAAGRQKGSGGGVGGGEWAAVARGLEWLRRHQDEDGKWDWVGYPRHCRQGLCDCPHGVDAGVARQGRNFSVGLTGLALLCFLGSGYAHAELPDETRSRCSAEFLSRHAAYRDVAGRALAWLLEAQQADGLFGPASDVPFEGYMYNHGICTLAVLDAYVLTGDAALAGPARRAVDFIRKAQGPDGGWGYVSRGRPEGRGNTRTDVSVSSWQAMALKAARDAGLPVDEGMRRKARDYFRAMTRPDGSLRYARAQDRREAAEEHLGRDSIGVTAAGVLSKLCLGWAPEAEDVREGAERMATELPDGTKALLRAPPGAEFNFHSEYYWYCGTLAMFHLGGEYRTRWAERVVPLVKSTQNLSGAAGSWDPRGEFLGSYAGRLGSTVFHILALEVFYRHVPLSGGAAGGGKDR